MHDTNEETTSPKHCPRCGAGLEDGMPFCSACGLKIEEQDVESNKANGGTTMFCTHCGHEIKEGAAFCNKCGERLAAPAADHPAPDSPGAAGPRPAPKKSRGKLVACITAVVIAVVAIGGILFADILTSTPSSPAKWVSSSSKTKLKSTSSSHSGPWYVDTWYGIGVTTTGVNDMDLDDAHVKAAMHTTLVLSPAGTAELNLTASYGSTSYTGTWVEDKDSDRDAVTLFLKESGTNNVSRFTLVCDDPEDEGSASCLVLYTNTDVVIAFCRDKKVAESSTWSISDLPSLDGLS